MAASMPDQGNCRTRVDFSMLNIRLGPNPSFESASFCLSRSGVIKDSALEGQSVWHLTSITPACAKCSLFHAL